MHVSVGDLKTPSVSIPKGTIVAVLYTFVVYLLLFILVSATCERSGFSYFFLLFEKLNIIIKRAKTFCFFFFLSRTLLTQDYGFLQKINVWPPFVTIGIYCSSLSAAMCAMIGASRILHALAVDQLFGEAANPSRRRLLGTRSLFPKSSLSSSQVCRWLQPPLRQTRGTRGWRCSTPGLWHRSALSLRGSVAKIPV